MWYNSTSGTLRGLAINKAWSSAAPINTARGYLAGITGTAGQTAGLIFGGNTANPGLTGATATEEYNGNGWSIGGNLATGRVGGAGLGTQTAAVFAGGRTPPSGSPPNDKDATITENYNGTSWTSGGALSTGRRYLSAAGTQTSGLAFAGTVGGAPGAGTAQSTTEEYDGSSWTSGGALNVARQSGAGTGESQSAAIMFGGSNAPSNAKTEIYDGTSWTAQPDMNSGTNAQAGFGTSASAISAGGETYRTNVEDWNGSTWSVNPATIAFGNQAMVGGGSATAGLIMGGWRPPPLGNTTQEYNVTTTVITAGAWAAGANYPATIQDAAGSGPVTAAAIYGGYTTVYTNATNEYDGTSYSGGGNMNTGRATYQTGTGSQTAALQAGGYATSSHTNASEEYNGSSWTSTPTLAYSRYGAVGGGVQTSALMIGGSGGPSPSSPNTAIDKTEEYDGSSWTAGGDLPAAQAGGSGFSGETSSAAIIAGFSPPNLVTLSYDGSSWTDVGHSLVQAVSTPAGGSQQGSNTLALIAGGLTPAPAHTVIAQQYNGTSWVTAPSMSTARRGGAAAGTAASCLAVGGESPQKNDTEEFTGETSVINIKNFSTS